jgi:hypothetical protein
LVEHLAKKETTILAEIFLNRQAPERWKVKLGERFFTVTDNLLHKVEAREVNLRNQIVSWDSCLWKPGKEE